MQPKFKRKDIVRVKDSERIDFLLEIVCPRLRLEGSFWYSLLGEDNFTYNIEESRLELVQGKSQKIIGYKVPFDMFGGEWKPCDIVLKLSTLSYYIPQKKYTIPKEIAETWEPVYEGIEQPKEEKPKTIFERVTDLRSACKELGIKHGEKFFNKEDYDSVGAMARLVIIVKALNEGWEPDWENTKQSKYRATYNHMNNVLLSTSNSYLSELPNSLYLKSKRLTEYLIKIAEKELLVFHIR